MVTPRPTRPGLGSPALATERLRRTVRARALEYALFGLALAVQSVAIVLRLTGSGFVEVVVSNWVAMGSYLVALAAVFIRYRGWDARRGDPRNHTYYLLFSPLAGIAVVGMVGADVEQGFANTAALVPGLIASSLVWGWSHASRMAPRVAFVEATETARTIFWGWMSLGTLTFIQFLSQRLSGAKPYVVPDLLAGIISIGAFVILVSTGYTQYQRAQEIIGRFAGLGDGVD